MGSAAQRNTAQTRESVPGQAEYGGVTVRSASPRGCCSSPQILADQGEAITRLHRAVQGVGDVEYCVIDQHFDVLGQISRIWIPESFV